MFTRYRIAVYIDGCFWHGCPQHSTLPKTNTSYWLPKLARNIERDRETDLALGDAHWTVLRYWEHEDPEDVAHKLAAVVQRAMASASR